MLLTFCSPDTCTRLDVAGVLQDVTVHRNEVHAKLVAIMRERLNANLKQLPAVADSWGAQPTLLAAPAPSSFAAANAKQLRILGQVCQGGRGIRLFAAVRTLSMGRDVARHIPEICQQKSSPSELVRAAWVKQVRRASERIGCCRCAGPGSVAAAGGAECHIRPCHLAVCAPTRRRFPAARPPGEQTSKPA
jgi:hypothetical protein